jgi:hypothetical protein
LTDDKEETAEVILLNMKDDISPRELGYKNKVESQLALHEEGEDSPRS